MGQVGQDITINIRSLHLPEAAGDTAEQEGDLGHILVGGQPKRRRGGVQGIVLQGVQIVGQHPLGVGEVGLEHDFVVQPGRIGAGDDLIQPHGIGRQRVAPVEAVQRHGGVVGDVLEGVADLLAGHDFCVAALADGHIGVDALVEELNLNDLAFMLQIHRHFFLADGVILGTGHFLHDIAAQRQRLRHRKSPAVALDGIHKGIGFVVDLKHRAFQRGPGREAVDGIVVRGLLPDLDLGCDRRVLPLDLGGSPVPYIDGLQLIIHQVAFVVQLSDIVAPAGESLNIDIAPVIADVFADGVFTAVIHQEMRAIDPFSGG